MKRLPLLLCALASAGAVAPCSGKPLDAEIARAGTSRYAVALPARPSPAEELAGEELAAYVERMSGAGVEIQRGGPAPARALIVCERAHVEREPAGPPVPELHGDEYAILSDGPRVLLVGARGRATLFAVYDFLERLGCRWLAPCFDHYRGSAELVPRRSRLSIPLPLQIVEKPAFAIRKLDVGEGVSHTTDNLRQLVEWMPKLRYNTLVLPYDQHGAGRAKWETWRDAITPELQKRDLTIEVGGHGYQNFLSPSMEGGKLFDLHPDWFGQDDTGARNRGEWDGHGRRVFCTTNPEAVRYLIASFLRYVKDHPEIETYDFWPPDGAVWCECARCRALGSPPDRQMHLVNQVRSALDAVRPDLRLEVIAYHQCLLPSASHRLDRTMLLDFCPDAQCFEVQIDDASAPSNASYQAALRRWRGEFQGDINIYTYYRKYMWRSLPVLLPHYVQRDLQYYQTVPVQGIQCYAEPGDWFTYELNHYVLGRLEWRPRDNVDALIRRFCKARYGAAAGDAVRVFDTLEGVVRRTCNIPMTSLKGADELARAQAGLERCTARLKSASRRASDQMVRYNLERLMLTVEYARRDIAAQALRASGAPAEAASSLDASTRGLLAAHAKEGLFLP